MRDHPLSQAQLIQSLIDVVNTIGLKGDYIKSHKKECASLTRRVKLLAPLFEELRESRQRISYQAFTALQDLDNALQSANKLLQMCHDGSKLYLVSLRALPCYLISVRIIFGSSLVSRSHSWLCAYGVL